MSNHEKLDDIAQKIRALLPSGLEHLQQDLHDKIKEVLQVAFSKLDLVTREEFDVQTKVLARTRDKVEHLEQLLQEVIHSKPKDA
jgi:BMFP domain-containing protein YqiC